MHCHAGSRGQLNQAKLHQHSPSLACTDLQVKLASCKYLDGLPTSGNKLGRAFRDLEWEESNR